MPPMLTLAVAMALPLHAARFGWGNGEDIPLPPEVKKVVAKARFQNNAAQDGKFALRCESTELLDVTGQQVEQRQIVKVKKGGGTGDATVTFMYTPSASVIDWRCWGQGAFDDVKNCVVRAGDTTWKKSGPVNDKHGTYMNAECSVSVKIETARPDLDYAGGVALQPDRTSAPTDLWG